MAKAKKIPYLDPEQPLDVSLRKILRTRFDEMISFEQGTIDGSDIEALHDMRVASRRVQAVFKIFRNVFPKKKYKAEYEEIRSLIRALGEVRDYDVFIEKMEKIRAQSDSADNRASVTDTRAIDMLIIRKKSERELKRKLLIQHLANLNKPSYNSGGYKQRFYDFIMEEL